MIQFKLVFNEDKMIELQNLRDLLFCYANVLKYWDSCCTVYWTEKNGHDKDWYKGEIKKLRLQIFDLENSDEFKKI